MTHIPDEQIKQLVEWAIEIQQIPSPTFSEKTRGQYLCSLFQEAGVKEIERDDTGNVYACIPGSSPRPLLVSAHLDSVHPTSQSLEVKRTPTQIIGPGIGDNALGLAALVDLAKTFANSDVKLPGTLWLVATVCEEGLGNLRGMRKVIEKFDSSSMCTIILEGIGLGQIQQRALGALRYRIEVKTPGGHSWSDFGSPSAIHELVKLAAGLQDLYLPGSPRTTLNIGIIHGGTAVNAIAQTACMEVDLRSEDHETLLNLASQVKHLVKCVQQTGVDVIIEEIGSRPAGGIPSSDIYLNLARKVLLNLGLNPKMIISSTDASLFIQRNEPVISIGLTTGSGVHTVNETIDLQPLSTGLKQLYAIINDIWSTSL